MHMHFGSILKNCSCKDNVFKKCSEVNASKQAQKLAWPYNGVVNTRPLQLFLSSFLEEQYLLIQSTALVPCCHSKLNAMLQSRDNRCQHAADLLHSQPAALSKSLNCISLTVLFSDHKTSPARLPAKVKNR